MKFLLTATLIALAPALSLAQAPAKAKSAPASAAKATVKKRGGQVVPKTTEEKIEIDDDPAVKLTPADLEVAKLVHTGDIACELGATVHVTPHKREGFFIVRVGLQRFRMHPVESRTGAIRLEDPVGGAMWLQLSNKSMLMSQKLGRRLADECMSTAQSAVADALKKNPMPSLLEPLPAASAAASAPVAAASAPAAAASAPVAAASAPPQASAPAAPASK
ncbi:hypothetical protein [Caenimonas aquaedulcis]|uniref:Uncharacterized protein n=1 Tax=Caenimonas aquaedulcis TaxID=2793270 RepID=A0A931H3D1_9BURK|nr:hypothetical protein [Caenimonas aquaedulcis]MBG9387835.1 hypothetical protein [Caenimonas aquaedulcis]